MTADAGSGLRDAIEAERRSIDTRDCGRVGYYVDDSVAGRPLLLVHSLNAAPSAMEMRPLFDHYRRERPVVALDLPGFGISERGDRDYTPELLADAVDAVAGVAFDAPADLIPLVSEHWGRHFRWQGDGPMPEDERRRLADFVERAHAKGRLVRFWATPDRPSPARTALWRELLAAGVDLINTDDLTGLQEFLLERQQ
jgi:hypothetical protein